MKFAEFLKENGFPAWEVGQSAMAVYAALETGRKLVKVHLTQYQTGMVETKWEAISSPCQLWLRASEHIEFEDCAPPEEQTYPQGRFGV